MKRYIRSDSPWMEFAAPSVVEPLEWDEPWAFVDNDPLDPITLRRACHGELGALACGHKPADADRVVNPLAAVERFGLPEPEPIAASPPSPRYLLSPYQCRKARLKAKMTQRQLASSVGRVGISAVALVETGRRTVGQAEFERWVEALGVPAEKLLWKGKAP